jgi:lipopolysaccharide transport system ATP-binding protein
MSSIISVSNLSKAYRIGKKADRADSFVGMLKDSVTAPFRNWRRMRQTTGESSDAESDLHWALKDVSFEVNEGEVLGVIGRNGAGKSTLLKILSRITEPTCGEARIRGRVASLLEVGTGFHPELSGRENVYLNGTILGMHKREIDQKFDEIVEFSGVEKFLDTPTKRYSSGMKVRLAFAVAAHLDPEILIVDEVLAVGDAEFQSKCQGKMQDVATGGRTVVFVSHNIAIVQALCDTGLVLEGGRVKSFSEIDEAVLAYTRPENEAIEGHTFALCSPNPLCDLKLGNLIVLKNGVPSETLNYGDRLSFRLDFCTEQEIDKPCVGFVIRSDRGHDVLNSNNHYLPCSRMSLPAKFGVVTCDLGAVPLMAGNYTLSLWFGRSIHEQHYIDNAARFRVEEKDIWGCGFLPPTKITALWWPCEFRF